MPTRERATNRDTQELDRLTGGSDRPDIEFLADALLNAPSMGERLRAAVGLVKLDNPSADKVLAGAAGDDDPTFRAKLVKAISRFRYPVVTQILIKAMYDADCYVRKSAVEAAQDLDNQESIKAIVACLKDEEINVRESAVIALESSSNADLIVEALSQTLTDSHWNVRRESIEVLAKTGLGSSVGPVKSMLMDEDPEVRRSALLGLANLVGREALDCAIRALNDRDAGVQLEAIYVLGRFGDTSVIPRLEGVAFAEELSAMVKQAALQSIKRIKQNGLS